MQHVDVRILEAIPRCQDLVNRFPRLAYHRRLPRSCTITQVWNCAELLPLSSLLGGDSLSGTDSTVRDGSVVSLFVELQSLPCIRSFPLPTSLFRRSNCCRTMSGSTRERTAFSLLLRPRMWSSSA